ncbi:hypothetical protein PGQ11_004516 [Apiospora arundinis]|uniref:Uncharacterized protein n=1 Tax=Apiospora arundinis TaxID=335852 RepID=A0ABR2J8A8_9PEZI
MGQYWRLVDIDRREELSQISKSNFPPYGLEGPILTDLLKLAKWKPITFDSNAIAASKRSGDRPSLVGLPQEIIDRIVELICEETAVDDGDDDISDGTPEMEQQRDTSSV